MQYLVIVESPAKATTIKKYLGKKYVVYASLGHLRDLPKSTLGVDIEKDFTPKYINIKGKGPLINELKKVALKSQKVFLATDPDREGEAISWHISNILNLDESDCNRITFNEITKTGVKNGVANPRKIDKNLVDAQQARRVLDRLVGYKLSPYLWKRVGPGLSAGRVQSVAVKLIVDREEEISKFVPEEFWTIEANLSSKNNNKNFTATLHSVNSKKVQIKNETKANEIVNSLKDADFIVKSIKKTDKNKSPAPPFTTSTLQQEASKRLNFRAAKTMQLAQKLYEGISVKNHGTVGLITYMRTDSLRISDEAINAARNLILNEFGEKFVPKKPRIFKSKANSQDGHEAIRPTIPSLTPKEVESSLTTDLFKIYSLIWQRFIASQTENAVLESTSIDIEANNSIFKLTGSVAKFPGHLKIFQEFNDEEDEKKQNADLPNLTENEKVNLIKLNPLKHHTKPPSRFTEASLTKYLEDYGIGRPSTYVPTLSTILNRGYVERDKKQLKPTQLGFTTTNLMKDNFSEIVDVSFTANIEKNFDEVSEGKLPWKESIRSFYSTFNENLIKAENNSKSYRLPIEETDEICENCGKTMVIKRSRFGKFLACSGYPDCKFTKKIVVKTNFKCPKCDGSIIKKKSAKGHSFYGCSNFPNCDFASWDDPTSETCSNCGANLFKNRTTKKVSCVICDEK